MREIEAGAAGEGAMSFFDTLESFAVGELLKSSFEIYLDTNIVQVPISLILLLLL
jgi:hypothetical protein